MAKEWQIQPADVSCNTWLDQPLSVQQKLRLIGERIPTMALEDQAWWSADADQSTQTHTTKQGAKG